MPYYKYNSKPSKPTFKIFRQMPSSVSLQMPLIYIYKVKSATLQKLLMGNYIIN